MYQDRFGCTNIINAPRDNLGISWDYHDDEHDKTQRVPCFLYTPDMSDTGEHYHITLDRFQAENLRDWLNAYLEDVM